jgi:6-phosphogluconolactonase
MGESASFGRWGRARGPQTRPAAMSRFWTREARAIRALALWWTVAGALASWGGCGHGIYGKPNPTPTSTSTPGAASFAYVTNNADAKVSEYSIDASSGALSLINTVAAGPAPGPAGIAAVPSGSFVYVVNSNDASVYAFRVLSSGKLSSIGTISAGASPQQIAINPAGTFAYVTNNGGASLSGYSIAADGSLKSIGTQGGFSLPLGVVVDPGGNFLYVTDPGNGTLRSFSIDSSGATTPVSSLPSLGGQGPGNPGLPAVASAGGFVYVYVPDRTFGVVAQFKVDASGNLTWVTNVATSAAGSQPFALAITPNGSFAYTTNQATDTLSQFSVNTQTGALTLQSAASSGLKGPTGLAVSPNGQNLYATNRGNGTIAQFAVNATTGALVPVGTVNSEKPANAASAPTGIALAP